jgi:hypothetical protein
VYCESVGQCIDVTRQARAHYDVEGAELRFDQNVGTGWATKTVWFYDGRKWGRYHTKAPRWQTDTTRPVGKSS